MFLKDCWYVAALDHELIDGKLLGRTLLGEHVLLYRGESGKVVALNDRCPHRGALLSKGRLEGDAVRCMYHGIKYDGSGKCVQIPGQDMIPPRLKVRGYPVVERSHFIWIWMGDAAKADPALIIDLPYLHDPNWKGIPAYLHYDANYLLIVDNLSDFSHLAFVHTGTLGGSEEYAFVTKPTVVEKLERGFRVERWHLNSDPPPFHKKVIRDKSTKVDRRNIATMIIPGIFHMETLFAAADQGAPAGNVAGAKEYRNCQFMTPETRADDAFLLVLSQQFRRRGLHDIAIAAGQPHRGLHGGQGDHRAPAEDARRGPELSNARHTRRRAAGAFPASARQSSSTPREVRQRINRPSREHRQRLPARLAVRSHAANGGIEHEPSHSDAAAQVGDRITAAPLDRFAQGNVLAAEGGRLALNLRRALHRPEQRESRGDIALADRDPMVAEHQHVLVAEACQHPAAFLGIQSDAFKIVIADAAVELRSVEIIVIETAAFHGDRRNRRGVRVRHAGDVRAALMDCPVQGEAGGIGGIFGGLDETAVDTHLEQIFRSDFRVVEPERIDQIVVRRSRAAAPKCD